MASLIVGCGFLGKRIAQRLVARGDTVFATATDQAGASLLAQEGMRVLLVDVSQPLTLAALTVVTGDGPVDLYYLVPRRAGVAGPGNVVRALAPKGVRKAVLASSTVVYGHKVHDVDAASPADPTDDRGRIQLDVEQQWLSCGTEFYVVRLAGLYGEGRIIGKKALLDGAPLVGDAHALLNLIHVEDAADLMIAVMSTDTAANIELGVDDGPSARLEYYRYLARQIGAGEPIALDAKQAQEILGLEVNQLRHASTKRCDNAPTKRRTGWSPKFTDFRAGIDHALGIGTAP